MFAKLSALVSGGPQLPYDLTDADGERTSGGWTHHSGTSKADKSEVSVFKYSFSPGGDARRMEAAKHGVKSLRTLRHPNVLIFKDSHEIEEKGATMLYLITEPVRLLKTVLEEEELSGEQRQVHGNVRSMSIVVSQNLDWKLSCLDTLSDHTSLSSSHLADYTAFLDDVYKCPELAKRDWESLTAGPPWAIDSWGLGCLIREVFGNGYLDSQAMLRETEVIPEDLLKDYQRLLNSQGQKRLNPHRLLKNKFLNSPLVEVVSFLESLAVKEATEKNSFFKKLTGILHQLPEMVVRQKILPIVIDALEFGSASPNALGCVMKIADSLDDDRFQSIIAPAIVRFFNTSDRTIRRVLLESIDKFGDQLSATMVDETIYPALSNGFSDSNAYLRELTLKSMQRFAPKLSQKTLNQSLLKFLAKLQVDPEPSIRANTTVLLGFIADDLGEASCKRILLNAFGRALKDSFPPARVAALKALIATKKYYSNEEIATKVILCVSPMTIDGSDDVRRSALGCLDVFLALLKEAANAASITEEIPETKAVSSGYVSWAVSSLGFSQTTESATKTGVIEKTSSKISSPKRVSEETSPTVQSSTAFGGTRASSSSKSGDEWDIDDEDFEDEATRPKKETVLKKATETVAPRKDQTEEHDVWDDLGMKAKAPAPTTRRKTGSKPMKLGAKKLNVD